MAYKKFIKKNGKIYGPYIYHSKRINGKVISEYHGTSNSKIKLNRRTILFPAIIIVILSVLFAFIFTPNLTGNVIGKIFQNENEMSNEFILSLKQGEFIPLESKVLIQTNDQNYSYTLKELYEGETIFGDYFLEETEITGFGEGIGIKGSIENLVPVYFELELIQKNPQESNNPVTEENDTQNEINDSEIEQENNNSETEEIIPTNEETNIETTNTQEEITILEEETETIEQENQVENTQTQNSFLPLTGESILEQKIIKGQVKKTENWTYDLQNNQDIKLISGSVKTQNNNLEDNQIKIESSQNEIIITTNYSEITQGFGQEFLGQEIEIKLNLIEVNLTKNQEINLFIIYENITLFESKQIIEIINIPIVEENKTIPLENITNEILNETLNLTEINQTNITEINIEKINLTEEEKTILRNHFKIIVLNITAQEYKNKILINFKIGDYELSNTYSSTIDEEILKEIIDRDKILWLKEISRELTKNNYTKTLNENLSSIYSII